MDRLKITFLLVVILFVSLSTSAQFTQLANVRICLDPGHGGHDSDDRPTDLGLPIIYYESDANWEAIAYADTLLKAFGAEVKITKTTNEPSDPDRDPSLSDRVQVANAFNSDYFHSFHTNGADNQDVNYTLVLYAGSTDDNPDDPDALAMAQIMDDELFEYMKTTNTIARADIPFTGFMNGLGVLNNLAMPGTLSEASFHSNLEEGRRLMNKDYRKAAAWGIVKSFIKYYDQPLPETGEFGGVVTDQSGNALNGITVTLNPDTETEQSYTGDEFLNGFYFFDWLEPGEFQVLYEKEGFISETKTINIDSGNYTELDVTLIDPNAAPSIPKILTLGNPGQSSGVNVTWTANSEPNLLGYRLYYSVNDELMEWALAADETTLTSDINSIEIQDHNDFLVVPDQDVYHFRLTAVAESGAESSYDDIYSRSSNTGGDKVLIVDGFDRYTGSGSYNSSRHEFATDYFIAIRDSKFVQVHTSSNEAVIDELVSLEDYELVVWFLGDESTADETFSDQEQSIVKSYLEQGGKLFISGAEVAWDLDQKGSSTDKNFFNNYLKSSYQADGATNYSPATGISGSFFEGLTLEFGIDYPEDFPDDIAPLAGAESILNYAVPGRRAGVAYKGSFGGSSEQGGVVLIGFPLETSSASDQLEFMNRVLEYFEIGNDDPVATQDITSLLNAHSTRLFPNPSEGQSILEIQLNEGQKQIWKMTIVNSNGQVLSQRKIEIHDGLNSIPLAVQNFAAGIYIIQLEYNDQKGVLKLVKN